MKKLFFGILFFSQIFLFAGEVTYLDLGTGIGYRRDTMQANTIFKSRVPGTPLFQFQYNPFRSVDWEVFARGFWHNFLVDVTGNFAWALSGKGEHIFVIIPNFAIPIQREFALFEFKKLTGFLVDGVGSVGYGIPLYTDAHCYFLLIPEGGYAVYYQSLKREDIRPNTLVIPPGAIPGTTLILQDDLSSHRFKSIWYGPFIGAEVEFDAYQEWQYIVGYFYHFLHLKQEDQFRIDQEIVGVLFNVDHVKTDVKASNGYGHRVKGRFAYSFAPYWKIAVTSSYSYFRVNRNDIKVDLERSTLTSEVSDERYLGWWHSFSILVDLIFNF